MNCLDLSDISKEWLEIIERIPLEIRQSINEKVEEARVTYEPGLEILPRRELRLQALRYFNPKETRVVIIGQDPYIKPNQPMGLCFSVPKGVAVPPSLKNIYKELQEDIKGFKIPSHGDLTEWAKQGVLLLNTSLTVLERLSNSHKGIWRDWTTRFISEFSKENPGVVYLLWGNDAKALKQFIHLTDNIIIEGAHPSPLARGAFFGGHYFSKTNLELEKIGKIPINWCLTE